MRGILSGGKPCLVIIRCTRCSGRLARYVRKSCPVIMVNKLQFLIVLISYDFLEHLHFCIYNIPNA